MSELRTAGVWFIAAMLYIMTLNQCTISDRLRDISQDSGEPIRVTLENSYQRAQTEELKMINYNLRMMREEKKCTK